VLAAAALLALLLATAVAATSTPCAAFDTVQVTEHERLAALGDDATSPSSRMQGSSNVRFVTFLRIQPLAAGL